MSTQPVHLEEGDVFLLVDVSVHIGCTAATRRGRRTRISSRRSGHTSIIHHRIRIRFLHHYSVPRSVHPFKSHAQTREVPVQRRQPHVDHVFDVVRLAPDDGSRGIAYSLLLVVPRHFQLARDVIICARAR